MAEAETFSPEFNAKIHEAFINGYTPQDVRNHLIESKNPEAQRWIAQLDSSPEQGAQDVAPNRPDIVQPQEQRDTSTPLLDMYGKTANQAVQATNDMSLNEKLGYGLGAAALAGGAGAIGNRLLSRVLPTPTERATALQANTYAKKTDLEAKQLAKETGISPIDQAKVTEIEAKIARENALHQLELEQKKELHQAKLAKINEKLMKGETIGPEGITPAEPTKGLAELENATGGPLNSVADVEFAKIYQSQNAPSAPPAQASAIPAPPPTPPSAPPSAPPQAPNPPQNPVKVAEAATPPSTLQGGAPVAPNGDVTVDENALKEAALNPSEKANNPELATNVQAKTDLQDKQVQDAILNQNRAALPATQPATPPVEIPEGRIPNYMTGKKDKNGKIIEYNNKQGKDVIGKGGWNWYQGQMGPEAETNWLNQFGRTNQEYKDVTQAVKEGRLTGAVVNEKGQGGKFPREPHVPNYIKGNVDIGMMAGILATGGIGALTAYMAQKHPDFATQYQKALEASGESTGTEGMLKSNKAEELSPAMRKIIIKSGNQNYRAEINKQLQTEKQAERIKELQRELSKAK